MPSDIILDSLCAEGIARKTIIPVRSSMPEYPYKSLGARHDTIYYNTATQYTINLYIQADTVVLVRNETGDFLKASKNALVRFDDWFHNYIMNGGASITGGSGGGGGGPSKHKPEHIDYYDLTLFVDLLGAIRPSPNKMKNALDYFSTIMNLLNGVSYLTESEEEPYIPGQGVLKPEEYQAEVAERDSMANKKKESITVPPKPVQFPTGNTPTLGGAQVQHLQIEVTIAPTQETIHMANKDSSSIMNAINESFNKADRDSLTFDGMRGGKRIQEEIIRRQDTTYYININLTSEGIKFNDHTTGETISKQKYEEIKRSK